MALRISEGIVDVREGLLSEQLPSTITMRVGCLAGRTGPRMQPDFHHGRRGRFRRRVDDSENGGAPFLGVAGLTIVSHGRSNARAVRHAVAVDYRVAANRFIERVEHEIAAAVPGR